MGSNLLCLRHTSQVLGGNPAGDRTERDVLVYLPKGYEDDPARRYPVVYVLAGFLGTGRTILNERPFSPGLGTRQDRLMETGAMKPTIVVLPDCFTKYGGSQYMNSTATGRYEDYLIDELIPFVDDQVRTRADPASRGVVGKSSGGFGALRLSMRRPGTFSAVASISGDAYFEYCYLPDFPKCFDLVQPHGSVGAFLHHWEGLNNQEGREVVALNVIAMAACFSPDISSPGEFVLPFSLETGELRADVWERWLECDPVRMAGPCSESLKGLKWLYLECGDRDEHGLHHGARIMSSRLKDAGVPHIYEEFSGGHRGLNYRYDIVLPQLVEALAC